MMERLKSNPWLSLAIAVVIISAWMGRFEISTTSAQERFVSYRLDRWTGSVRVYVGAAYIEARPRKL